MSQDLRIYSLSLIIVLMLLASPAHASYGTGSTCPVLQVLVNLDDNSVYDGGANGDLRNLYSLSGNGVSVAETSDGPDFEGCELYVGQGTYYDNANHLWTLDQDIGCEVTNGNTWDFRAGNEY